MTPPSGFSTPPHIPNVNTNERPPVTTVFAATTPRNIPFAYRASTSTDPTPMISPAFVEANYEILESLLRDRRRQICNEDLRTELEYFNKDYDEEREMEPRPERTREVTPPLHTRSPRVLRQREKVVGFEEAPNREGSRTRKNTEGNRPSEAGAEENGRREMNLPPLLAAHLGRNENGQPLQSSLTSVHGGRQSSINIGGNLLPNGLFVDPTRSVTPFVRWIEDYPLPDGLKMPSHVGSYDGKGDPDNFLHLFEGAIRMQKWLMPVACHMFTYTLKDSARIWWNSQKAGSILNYEDLKAKFRSHFSQQKRFAKTHLAVHIIKQREGESVRAFATRYTDYTLQILGLHEDQRIYGFVNGLRTRNLIEHLSTDLPSTYKGLMENTYTWIKAREVATNGAPNDRRDNFERSRKSSWDNGRGQKSKDKFSPYRGPNHGLFSSLSKSPREILATEKVAKTFEQHPWLPGNINKACPKENHSLPTTESKVKDIPQHQFKCFLDTYKGYHQIPIAEKDEEKTAFYTREGVFCYRRLPFGLKNAGETYQRLIDKVFSCQVGRIMEVNADKMLIKSNSEEEMLADIKETLERLRLINLKLNPKKCSFGV
ncbi:reverse transcriptase domain-containing protein [Tanacetum coccineum]